MSIEQYLRMSDIDLKNLIASNNGEYYSDPFIHSVLYHGAIREEIEEIENIIEEEEFEDLLDILPDEKFNDDDFINHDNLEN